LVAIIDLDQLQRQPRAQAGGRGKVGAHIFRGHLLVKVIPRTPAGLGGKLCGRVGDAVLARHGIQVNAQRVGVIQVHEGQAGPIGGDLRAGVQTRPIAVGPHHQSRVQWVEVGLDEAEVVFLREKARQDALARGAVAQHAKQVAGKRAAP
jgi:hypothetical protein